MRLPKESSLVDCPICRLDTQVYLADCQYPYDHGQLQEHQWSQIWILQATYHDNARHGPKSCNASVLDSSSIQLLQSKPGFKVLTWM